MRRMRTFKDGQKILECVGGTHGRELAERCLQKERGNADQEQHEKEGNQKWRSTMLKDQERKPPNVSKT